MHREVSNKIPLDYGFSNMMVREYSQTWLINSGQMSNGATKKLEEVLASTKQNSGVMKDGKPYLCYCES